MSQRPYPRPCGRASFSFGTKRYGKPDGLAVLQFSESRTKRCGRLKIIAPAAAIPSETAPRTTAARATVARQPIEKPRNDGRGRRRRDLRRYGIAFDDDRRFDAGQLDVGHVNYRFHISLPLRQTAPKPRLPPRDREAQTPPADRKSGKILRRSLRCPRRTSFLRESDR